MSAPNYAPLDDLLAPTDHRPWWRRTLVGVAAILVVVLVGALATGALGAGGTGYRTAVAEEQAVDAELTGVATIEPVSQATVGFPASGTVASVSVQVGDEVAAGDVLAQLDTAALEQQLHAAEASLAEAQLTLENGLNGEKATTAPGGSAGASGSSAQFASSTTGTRSTSRIVLMAASTDPELQAAQRAVLDAQRQVDLALAAAETAYANALTVCGFDGKAQTSETAGPTGDTVDTPDPDACATALQESLTAQKDVQTAQHQLVAASVAYDDLLAQRAAELGTPDPGASPEGGGAAPSGPDPGGSASVGATSGGSGGMTAPSSAPSSADLIAYQKAVDAADADVAVAHQAIAQATITTPIAGTVVAVNLSAGEAVSDAATQNVVVEGEGGFEATTTVSVTDVADVKVGQRASVSPDGSDRVLEGAVASVAVAPVSSATSTSYRVTIALDDPAADLDNGNTGTVSIVTEASEAGLAVPSSAVQVGNGRHFVTVVDGDTTNQVFVDVGVVGREWTSITDGLTAGDVVVLADLAEPLPSSATESSNETGGGNFPFPGGGAGGPPAFGDGPPGN